MIKTKSSILLYLCVVMGLCMTITSTQAQSSTHTGNITVSTQAQVDALSTTLAGKTTIAGNLIIGYEFGLSRSNITDLTPLSNITHIKRNLIIRRNGQLVNLHGLYNLQTITGGDFRLEYNDRLTTVDFSKLETIAGYFDVNHNDRLTTLGNFPVLQTMGRFFRVWENDRLTTLGNFPVLRSISEHFSVFENNRLTTLGNFPVLTSIGLGFYNVYVPTLFRKLNRVSLVVEYNPELPDDSVRSKLMRFLPGGSSAVRGYIFINRIKQRTYLGDITVSTQAELNALFTTLISIDTIDGDLTIGYTDTGSTSDITDLTPLGNIAHITGNLIIEQNGELVNQKSLTNLQTIGGYFQVNDNARLTALNFSKLETIGGYFSISNNDGLTAFDFSKLQTIGGYFQVNDNSRLTAFDFSRLQTIEGYFAVQNNDGLTSFGNFTKLQIVEGYVDVNNNDRLTTLGNFSKLETIEGYFSVTNNDTLTTLGSFPALLRIGIGTVPSAGQSREGVSILVENNPKLSNCSVLSGFLSGKDFAVSGEIFINANTTGCNSPSTIEVSNISRVYIGDITVRTQAELNSLRAILRNIHTIEGSVTIGYHETGQPRGDITDLTPFRNIVHITGNLYVFRNHQLVDMSPLTNLQTVGGEFDIVRNTRITTLNFPVLKTTGGRLFRVPADDKTTGGRLFRIVDNSRVTTLNFPVLDSIKGHVQILQSAHLNFPVLQTIEGNLEVVGNNTLNFSVLQTIEGYLAVQHSDILTTLDFPVLQTVEGFFNVSYNDRLTTLNFPVLQTIGRYFQVNDNHKLTTLGVFPALEIIEESFIVRRNSRLTTLGNFPVLTSIGEHLTTLSVSVRVENNSSLSDCYILTEFLSERVHAVKGSISIRNNATDGGCNSQNGIINSTYQGDITVTTQAQVNALRDTLAGKTRVEGNLTIGYTSGNSRSDITDLTPLRNIVHIMGNLIIQQNGQLANLNPLTNLQSIGKFLRVHDNDQLTTLGDFPELMSIGKNDSVNIPSLNELKNNVSIVVEGNDRLFTCCVLTDFFSDGVNAVSGDIFINGNATGCNSKSEINVITLTLTSSDETIAYNDPDFIAIDFTVGCGATGWTSAITYTPANANFITLSSAGGTGQTGVITLMATPTENTGVERTATITLSTTGGTASQTVVITQEALPDYIYIGNITVSTQAEVDALRSTLSEKTRIRGNLIIGYTSGSSQSNITNLTPLSNITHITGNLRIQQNGQPINLNGLDSLQSIGGNFIVGLNTRLTNFGDFPVLRSIGGYFNVYVNNRLTTLDFPVLNSIGKFLRVHDNDQLTALGGFPALTSIGIGALNRRNNGVSIVVQNNLRLSDCYTLTEFLPGGAHAVLGSVTIQNNATGGGCNSQNGITNSIYQGNITVTTQAEVDALRDTLAGKIRIAGNLTIGYTDNGSTRSDITDLTPLRNIVRITENLIIQQNAQLVNLNDLNNLQTIGEYFGVSSNDQLTTLGDFPALMSIGVGEAFVPSSDDDIENISIVVEENPRLSNCYVLTEFISGGATVVSGDIYINDNAIGCNSENDIKTTYLGDITVTTQAEVDALRDTLSDKTIINGNLTVGYTDSTLQTRITGLTPLRNIVHITGSLIIQQNRQLVNLNGLTHLQTIGGYFGVVKNNTLPTLGDFPILRFVGGEFYVTNNDTLTSLGVFPALTSIGRSNGIYIPSLNENRNDISIVVENNSSLSDCYVLTEFISGGATVVSGDIYIKNNAIGCNSQNEIKTTYLGDITVTTQTEVNALRDTLSGKTIINGNLTIGHTSGNSRSDITDLTPLINMTRITGNLIIQQNGQLVDFTGLNNLQSIGGYFNVQNNDVLTTLGNFPTLTSIGRSNGIYIPSLRVERNNVSIVVENNSNLSDCYVLTEFILGGTTVVSGGIYINNNAMGCNSQNEIKIRHRGDIIVTTQAEVNDLSTILSGKTIIVGNLNVGDTTGSSRSGITDLTSLSNIVHITGNILIQQNGQLVSLNDLNNLQTIGGYFGVVKNNRLSTLGDFPDLQTVGGYFSVWMNDTLTSLGNFPALQTIGEEFYVTNNDTLTDLGNFPALTSIGVGEARVPSLNESRNNVSIVVENNFNLSDCYVLTDFLLGGMHTVSGDIYINNNANSCNSQDKIIETEKIIYRGDITVITQAEVNDLSTILSGKTIIIGNLTIGYTSGGSRSDITDLTPLRNMTRITGNVLIQQNRQLVDLTGFNNLQSIGGYFGVVKNNTLPTLGIFPNLTSIGIGNVYVLRESQITENVSIVVEENPRLSNCHVLTEFLSGGATAVSGEIYINNNAISCNSENDIKIRYRGDITVTTQVQVNALRTSLSGKTIIVGNLTIGETSGSLRSDITDLTPLSSITDITGDVLIQQNGQLVELTGLNNLQSIGGYFSVSSNDILTSLGNFPTLTSIGIKEQVSVSDSLMNDVSIVVEKNPRLSDCHELTDFLLGGTTAVSGGIYINDNAIGCNSSSEIKTTYLGDITVTTQAEVNALGDTLAGKIIINGNLTIGHADSILRTNISDLTPLISITDITGDVLIQQNGQLVNLTKLNKLQTIGGYFGVVKNNTLPTLGDFPVLRFIGGGFHVTNNDTLTSLGKFPTLMSIGADNNRLTPSLDDDIENISIVVKENPRLSDCDVLTDFLSGGATSVSGGIYINNNAIGCNSQKDIKSTYINDITVTTQSEVDTLRGTLSSKTIIIGNLTVGYVSGSSRSDITDLTPLSSITGITGNVLIQQNRQLVNLNDLNNLQTIGGYFSVSSNDTLTSLGDFPNLQTIGGGFHVTNNDTLTSLGNFPELMSIGTSSNVFVPSLSRNGNNVSIVVEENTRLSDCYVLTEFLLGGTHAVSGGIYIKDNAISCNSENDIKIRYSGDITVTTQAEVDTLRITLADKTIIVGNLTVGYTTGSSRSDIIDLTPLSNIVHITENVLIQQNGQLVNLDGLNTLQSIGGYFSVTSNDRLTSLGNFPNLTNIGTSSNVFVPSLSRNGNDVSIVVEKNPRLSDCHELTKFISGGTRTVSGGIYINDNAIGCNSQDEIKTRYRGDITVTTQAEVDDLSTILFEKTIIVGNLIIGDTSGVSRSDITDLTLLSSIILITDITGDVLIQQNGKLVFEGLQHLKSIGGYFGVVKNDTLTTLGNFPALQSIGEDFYVTNNDILTDLGNFPVLTSIGIGNNRLIPSLDGVRNNVSIVVKENPRLSNCDALTGFLSGGTTVVSGDIYINENAIGCNSQDEIKTTYRGDITVTTQEEVNALHNTLSGKTIINGNLTIGYVSGSSRSDITDLTPLSSITDVTGYVRIQQNGQLVNLNALTHLQSIGGEFYIANNDSLASLGDFPDLQTIGGYFSVFLNKRLTTLGNFPDLQTIGRYFRVRNNDILTTLGDFSVLQTIGGYFSVFRNKRLTTLGDFPDLQTIEGYFSIYKNDTLTTFGNFPALTSIGSGSTHVPSEEGMVDNVSIVVEENPRLSDCCVLASFINEENNRIKGAKFIIDNAPGCNEDTIQNTCHTLVVTTKKIHEIAYDNTEPISISLTVGGISTGWASGITYAPNTNFITLNPPKKNETGNFTIMVTPTANEDIIPRSAIIILRTTGREGTPDSVSLTIKQAAAPMIMLTSHTDGDSIVIIHDDTNPIPISFTLGGSATSSMSSISYTPENTNFITLEPENNDEETRTITITPSVNEDIIPRTATITLRTTGHEGTPDSVSLTIKQAAAPMIMLTSHTDGDSIVIIHDDTNPITINFTIGGSATSSMSSISYMPENANFIMLQPENNNEETRAITITPLANTNTESRSATITLVTTGHEGTPDSVSLTITQETSPTIMLISHTEDENITIAYDNTEFIPISFTAGGTVTDWTSAITYTPANANFITLSPTEGTSQTDTITLMATPTENTGVERTATITLITTGIGTPDSVSLTITQETSPTIMLISHTEDENITIAYDNTDPITIDFTLGGSATSSMSNISYMPENTNFITLQPEDNDEETTSITITPSINEDTIPRTAAITLRTTGHEGTPDSVSLTITQGARADTTVTMPPTDTTTTLYSYTRVDFSLYPNPTKGTLTIEGVTGFLQMYIHDLVGREVMTYSLTPSKKTIDVSDLPSGMYVVTLQGEDKTWKETLMKR